MKLECLAGSQLERAVGILVGESVKGEPLARAADATGHPDAGHEREGLFPALLAALMAKITIVLRVDAVKLRQLRTLLRDAASGRVGEVAENVSTEKIAPSLEMLVLVERFFGGGWSGGHGGAHAKVWEARAARVSFKEVVSASSASEWVPMSSVRRQCAGEARQIAAMSPPGPA